MKAILFVTENNKIQNMFIKEVCDRACDCTIQAQIDETTDLKQYDLIIIDVDFSVTKNIKLERSKLKKHYKEYNKKILLLYMEKKLLFEFVRRHSIETSSLYFRYYFKTNEIKNLVKNILQNDKGTAELDYSKKCQLTKKEQNILILLSEGKSNKQIADEMYLSVHTIKTHNYNLFKKLGAKNRIQAINMYKQEFDNASNL